MTSDKGKDWICGSPNFRPPTWRCGLSPEIMHEHTQTVPPTPLTETLVTTAVEACARMATVRWMCAGFLSTASRQNGQLYLLFTASGLPKAAVNCCAMNLLAGISYRFASNHRRIHCIVHVYVMVDVKGERRIADALSAGSIGQLRCAFLA